MQSVLTRICSAVGTAVVDAEGTYLVSYHMYIRYTRTYGPVATINIYVQQKLKAGATGGAVTVSLYYLNFEKTKTW